MTLAEMLSELYANENFGTFDGLYLHRAIRRFRGELVFGRDAIRQQVLADLVQFSGWRFKINVSTEEFADVAWISPDGTSVRRHYWIKLENGRIASDAILTRSPHQERLHQHHLLLGELDSGKGQTGPAELSGFSATAENLHKIWNCRSISSIPNLYHSEAHWSGPESEGGAQELKVWWRQQFLAYPQSHITFEREIAFENYLALQWQWARIDKNGHRDRVAGSTCLRLDGGKVIEEVMLTD
ncbi:MAG: nuclear transport factor 2 family protein [Hyphomonadaceae bacterium]